MLTNEVHCCEETSIKPYLAIWFWKKKILSGNDESGLRKFCPTNDKELN